MTNQFNIKVTGGNATFGNALQGDNNTADAKVRVSAVLDKAAKDASSHISDLASSEHRSSDELKAVLAQLHALRDLCAEKSPDPKTGSGILKTIRENYSWAYPLVKDFVTAAWPALLTLI